MGDPNAGVVSSSEALGLTYTERLERALETFILESHNAELCDQARQILASKPE